MSHFFSVRPLLFSGLSNLPVLVLTILVAFIAWRNIIPDTYYTGWDNIHAEFNFGRYVRQVSFGAWLEHMGLGGPAAQAHLAEVPRLPLLYLLYVFLPTNLVRYTFIFLMYWLGGITMYYYLRLAWLSRTQDLSTQSRQSSKLKSSSLKSLAPNRSSIPPPTLPAGSASLHPTFIPWLALLGASFYLLSMLTIQQFYIAFEMFAVQFAFYPLLLLLIHRLAQLDATTQHTGKQLKAQQLREQRIDERHLRQRLSLKRPSRTLLAFILVQLCLAPSAHTPTLFYLGAAFSLFYALLVRWQQTRRGALRFTCFLAILTLMIHSFWIIPNLDFAWRHSHYVTESRSNRLFNPEAIWSVRESTGWPQLFTSLQYLFNWRDYSFANQQLEFIFQEWQQHLARPLPLFLLALLSLLPLVGCLLLALDASAGLQRWALITLYLFCLIFLWLDWPILNQFIQACYQSSLFTQIFRNPFTKFSILLSVAEAVCLTSVLTLLVRRWQARPLLAFLPLLGSLLAIVLVALPVFQGQLLNEKLRTSYPPQYQQLFHYLSQRDADLRILLLPQFSHADWIYHDWRPWLTENPEHHSDPRLRRHQKFQDFQDRQGYQGMGFFFFGVEQAVLSRDFDRWLETSDSFFHQLKYALDSHSPEYFQQILAKYRVDLVVLDQSKTSPHQQYQSQQDQQLLAAANFKSIWHQDFLTVYQAPTVHSEQVFAPEQFSLTQANLTRVRQDPIFAQHGAYLNLVKHTDLDWLPQPQATITTYPLAQLTCPDLTQLEFVQNDSDELSLTTSTQGNHLYLPGFTEQQWVTPLQATYHQGKVVINLPSYQLSLDQHTWPVLAAPTFQFKVQASESRAALQAPTQNAGQSFSQAEVIIVVDNQGWRLQPDQSIYPVVSLKRHQPLVIKYSLDSLSAGNHSVILDGEHSFDLPWEQWSQPLSVSLDSATSQHNSESVVIRLTSNFSAVKAKLDATSVLNCSQPLRGRIAVSPLQINQHTLLTPLIKPVSALTYQAQDFAVNCHHFQSRAIVTSADYIASLTSSNFHGRGIKLFTSALQSEQFRSNSGTLDTFLLSEQIGSKIDHEQLYSLPAINLNSASDLLYQSYLFNWETRSFGGLSQNSLQQLSFTPIPMRYLSQLQITTVRANAGVKADSRALQPGAGLLNNQAKINRHIRFADFLHKVTYTCPRQPCLVAFDQSYDGLWLGWNQGQLRSHYQLNNWANAWQVAASRTTVARREQKLFVLYLPGLVSFLCLLLVLGGLAVLIMVFLVRCPHYYQHE